MVGLVNIKVKPCIESSHRVMGSELSFCCKGNNRPRVMWNVWRCRSSSYLATTTKKSLHLLNIALDANVRKFEEGRRFVFRATRYDSEGLQGDSSICHDAFRILHNKISDPPFTYAKKLGQEGQRCNALLDHRSWQTPKKARQPKVMDILIQWNCQGIHSSQ